jgi:hypothetical protein
MECYSEDEKKSGRRTTFNTTIMHNSKKTYPYLTDGKGAGSFFLSRI